MHQAEVYAELFTLQAKAYTDTPASSNGHHDSTDVTVTLQPQRANATESRARS
jgi:hypothetical protein